jgi:hypothetical protein
MAQLTGYLRGGAATPFEPTTPSGERLVLVFLARTDARELADYAALEHEFASRGARIVAVGPRERIAIVRALAEALPPVRFPVVADAGGTLAAAYGIGRGVVVLGGDGRVETRALVGEAADALRLLDRPRLRAVA